MSDYDFDDFDNELTEQEDLQFRITEAVADGDDVQEVHQMLSHYEELYGQDLFWKQTRFDLAEVEKDPKRMSEILSMFDPDEVDPLMMEMNRARVSFLFGEYQEAMDALNHIGSLDDSEEALMFLHLKAYCALALHDYKLAANCMEDVLLDFNDTQSLVVCALAYLAMGDHERAESYLKPALERMDDGDLEWMVSFMISFELTDLLEDPVFPNAARQMYLEELEENSGISLHSVEMLIDNRPEVILSFIHEELDDHEINSVTQYLTALCYEKLNDEKMAKKYFRKCLRTPFPQDATEEDYREILPLKLISLERLGMSDKASENAVMDLFEQTRKYPDCLLDLISYCGIHHYMDCLETILMEEPLPETTTDKDEFMLKDALMEFLMSHDELSPAVDLAFSMYGRRDDLMYLLKFAYLCSFADEKVDFPDVDSVEAGPADPGDFVLRLHIEMLLDHRDSFVKHYKKALREKRYRPDEDWSCLDDYLNIFQEDIADMLNDKQPSGKDRK